MTDMELAHRLGDTRREKGLSQSQLADKSGVKILTIQKLETGTNRILGAKAETVLKLARALDTTVENLLGSN